MEVSEGTNLNCINRVFYKITKISLVSMITLFISFTQFNKSNVCRNTIYSCWWRKRNEVAGRAWKGSDREENGSARVSLVGDRGFPDNTRVLIQVRTGIKH